MKKVELLIPVKQFANLKITIEGTEEEIDKEIKRLWMKWFNYFEGGIDKANGELNLLSEKKTRRSSVNYDKRQKRDNELINEIQADSDKEDEVQYNSK